MNGQAGFIMSSCSIDAICEESNEVDDNILNIDVDTATDPDLNSNFDRNTPKGCDSVRHQLLLGCYVGQPVGKDKTNLCFVLESNSDYNSIHPQWKKDFSIENQLKLKMMRIKSFFPANVEQNLKESQKFHEIIRSCNRQNNENFGQNNKDNSNSNENSSNNVDNHTLSSINIDEDGNEKNNNYYDDDNHCNNDNDNNNNDSNNSSNKDGNNNNNNNNNHNNNDYNSDNNDDNDNSSQFKSLNKSQKIFRGVGSLVYPSRVKEAGRDSPHIGSTTTSTSPSPVSHLNSPVSVARKIFSFISKRRVSKTSSKDEKRDDKRDEDKYEGEDEDGVRGDRYERNGDKGKIRVMDSIIRKGEEDTASRSKNSTNIKINNNNENSRTWTTIRDQDVHDFDDDSTALCSNVEGRGMKEDHETRMKFDSVKEEISRKVLLGMEEMRSGGVEEEAERNRKDKVEDRGGSERKEEIEKGCVKETDNDVMMSMTDACYPCLADNQLVSGTASATNVSRTSSTSFSTSLGSSTSTSEFIVDHSVQINKNVMIEDIMIIERNNNDDSNYKINRNISTNIHKKINDVDPIKNSILTDSKSMKSTIASQALTSRINGVDEIKHPCGPAFIKDAIRLFQIYLGTERQFPLGTESKFPLGIESEFPTLGRLHNENSACQSEKEYDRVRGRHSGEDTERKEDSDEEKAKAKEREKEKEREEGKKEQEWERDVEVDLNINWVQRAMKRGVKVECSMVAGSTWQVSSKPLPFHSALLYSILLYSTLSYFILFHSTLSYSILLYSILFCSTPFYSIPLYPILL